MSVVIAGLVDNMNEALSPQCEADIAACVGDAAASASPLEIVGGGSRLGLGRPVKAVKKLSIAKHSGITLYEPGALTMVAKAGTPLQEVEKALAAEGQRLPFEPMDHRVLLESHGTPTIGGTVACNNSGSRRIQAGACRDSLIGVRFVNGEGEIIKNGGRVMKNVTGLDLVKLMSGSFGTLGVLTEVAFKVLPVNEREATLAFIDLDATQAVVTMSKALGSPFEVTGAAYLPEHDGKSLTALRVEGFAGQVNYKIEKLRALLGQADLIEGAAHFKLWKGIANVELLSANDGNIWKISVTPSAAPRIVEALKVEFDADIALDWGGGLIWASVQNSSPERVREIVGSGHATLIKAPETVRSSVPVFHPQAARLKQISKDLRSKFDPKGILNPGRMAALG